MHIHTHTNMYDTLTYTHVQTCTHTHTLMYTHTHTRTHIHTHSVTCTCIRTCTNTYTHKSRHAFTVTCTHISAYVYNTNQLGNICAWAAGEAKLTHKHSCTCILNTFAHTRTTHFATRSCTHMQTCGLSFVISLVPQKVILHSLYRSGSVNHVKLYLLFVADTE